MGQTPQTMNHLDAATLPAESPIRRILLDDYYRTAPIDDLVIHIGGVVGRSVIIANEAIRLKSILDARLREASLQKRRSEPDKPYRPRLKWIKSTLT